MLGRRRFKASSGARLASGERPQAGRRSAAAAASSPGSGTRASESGQNSEPAGVEPERRDSRGWNVGARGFSAALEAEEPRPRRGDRRELPNPHQHRASPRWPLAAWRAGDRADRQGACGGRAAALQRGWACRCAALRGALGLLRPRPAAPFALSPPCGSCVLGARVCMCGELGVRAHFVYHASAARSTPLRVAGWPVPASAAAGHCGDQPPPRFCLLLFAACVRACVLRR